MVPALISQHPDRAEHVYICIFTDFMLLIQARIHTSPAVPTRTRRTGPPAMPQSLNTIIVHLQAETCSRKHTTRAGHVMQTPILQSWVGSRPASSMASRIISPSSISSFSVEPSSRLNSTVNALQLYTRNLMWVMQPWARLCRASAVDYSQPFIHPKRIVFRHRTVQDSLDVV